MHKIIAIGESVLDTLYDSENRPIKSFVGGRIANTAALLGKAGKQVTMVSECCTDHTGDIIVNFLASNGVNTHSIDRFTDGATAVSLIFENSGDVKRINFDKYPGCRFDVVWPRIDEDDVVLFGSFYSIADDLRTRLFEMVNYANERNAIIMYLPGCRHGINCRITKVMPAILENIEIADIMIANRSDIEAIYPGEDAETVFKNHIEFYDTQFLFVDDDYSVTAFARGSKVTTAPRKAYAGDDLGWHSRFVAAVIAEIGNRNISRKSIAAMPQVWAEVLNKAVEIADNKQ